MSAYACLNSFHQHCLCEFSSYGNVKPWLLLAERYVQSKSVNRVPTESSAQQSSPRTGQTEARNQSTNHLQQSFSNRVWKMDLYDLNSSNDICAASYALQFLCASQINQERHPILVKRFVFHKPFVKNKVLNYFNCYLNLWSVSVWSFSAWEG